MARGGFAANEWMIHLPMVLLGLRSSIREDGDMSPAELVYGSSVRLPGELLPDPSTSPIASPSDFLGLLRGSLREALPLPVVHHGHHVAQVPSSISRAEFVYVRIDAV